MQAIGTILEKKESNTKKENKNQLISTGININKIPVAIPPYNPPTYENDQLYEQLTGLVNPQYKAWYMKVFYSLGRQRVLQLAGVARADGRDQAKLFSHLLRHNALDF